ncbi:class I SAM-dependent methyltransferase [Candidatus Caldatribacterium saccharofermentans]|uniref:class I SAM-dependent methyltransferase n=1 Tax=Candidatus Caldatribacterium saccharofermentans TaxID=1454753 RepID=UPI003D06130A
MEREHLHRVFWDAHVGKERRREKNPFKRVHTDLVWLEIAPFVEPGLRVLDAGGGYGRYSVALAREGCQVVHLDLSPRMLEEARKIARREGVEQRMTFVLGKVQDLSAFTDQAFDLVISLDAPVSYAYPSEKQALRELCRVTRGTLIVSVVNRLGQLPVALEVEARWRKDFALSRKFLEEGNWDHPPFFQAMEEKIPLLSRLLFPPLHAFLPMELVNEVESSGFRVQRVVATGTLSRLVSPRTLRRIVRNPKLYEEFLKLSHWYDAHFEVLGVGSRVASGLLVVARREGEHHAGVV